jgi:hypothetical protein
MLSREISPRLVQREDGTALSLSLSLAVEFRIVDRFLSDIGAKLNPFVDGNFCSEIPVKSTPFVTA